jgi:menaquinone-specific isochorismate synthase
VGELTAVTRRVDGDVDLVGAAGPEGVLFERGRVGLAGRGVARRVPVAAAADALAAIAVDDEVGLPGCGPVGFAALPFLRSRWGEATVVVPSVVWGRAEDGTRWVTTIGEGDLEVPPAAAPVAARAAAPGALRIAPTKPASAWCDLVADATEAIRTSGGALEKVVLAREVVVDADEPFDRAVVLARLRASYPGCFITCVDGFVGASPELLVGRSGDVVRAQPMAGTAPRGGDPATDARLAAGLLASATYRHEHQVTIDDVHDRLLAFCSYVDFEPEPSVVAVANVQHLATLVEGRLSRPAPSVLELVAALHPTPAVNGRPRDAATAWIEANEGFDRGRYAGTVGWVDGAGNGQWAVSVRCAEVDGRRARVFAGNGIVAGSEPDTELAETQAKLQAVLSALVRV